MVLPRRQAKASSNPKADSSSDFSRMPLFLHSAQRLRKSVEKSDKDPSVGGEKGGSSEILVPEPRRGAHADVKIVPSAAGAGGMPWYGEQGASVPEEHAQ